MIHLLELCKNAGSIGISGHVHPDGDCVGSTMGLWQFLKKAYPDKQIDVRIEPVLEAYAFVKGVSEIVSDHSDEQYDVFIVADSVPSLRYSSSAISLLFSPSATSSMIESSLPLIS